MYWLLDPATKKTVRQDIERLVDAISRITGQTQSDQLFPYVGRKDLRKARAIVRSLSSANDLVVDPFAGSGIFAYAAEMEDRRILANEWEPYAWRMSTAPWRLPASGDIAAALNELALRVKPEIDDLYAITCTCGRDHVLDSQFFDRAPLRYRDVSAHERLGSNGETITFRGKYKCPHCGRSEKPFTDEDQIHIDEVNRRPLDDFATELFAQNLIVNSRINLSPRFAKYGLLFPHRSKLALSFLWKGIHELTTDALTRQFLEDAFFSVLPQAKFKDYRSKSQDLHVPDRQLREVNIYSRFLDQVANRERRLSQYSLAPTNKKMPIECADFRDFLESLPDKRISLILTDPPWTDGNAYFEKAQLYHPWLGFKLSDDTDRLEREFVVTDAPSRATTHDMSRWWKDIGTFFGLASKKVSDLGYMAIYFRPIPASKWLQNLNALKFRARQAGFEPLLTIDAASKDPSMRIQQSASFVFANDLVFVFLKLPHHMRRVFENDVDVDYLVFKTGSDLQEDSRGPFTKKEWQTRFSKTCMEQGLGQLLLPGRNAQIETLFDRYIREVTPGNYLVKPDTPFNGQLFDIPVQERLFSFVPQIIRELTQDDAHFSYDMFLLKLAAFVENGTRMLIQSIESIDIKRLIEPYAEPLPGGKLFQRKKMPAIPGSVQRLMDLDPYDFEKFTATLLKTQGFTDVVLMGGSGDRGVDVTAFDQTGRSVVVQCKRYLGNVSADPIQRLHSFAVTRGAQRKIVITTAGFTAQARDEAQRTDTELIDGKQLEDLVQRFMPEFLSDSSENED